MDFNEAVVRRRSVRKFKSDLVPAKTIQKVLEAGRWAPSASNLQPWHFIVIQDVHVKRRIANVCTEFSKKAWADFNSDMIKYLALRGGTCDKSYMEKVPALIAVCYRKAGKMRHELILASAWTAIENMLLAATSEGLGSCIYTLYSRYEEKEVKTVLNMPAEYRIAAIVQLGYPVAETPSPYRKNLEEIVSYEHF